MIEAAIGILGALAGAVVGVWLGKRTSANELAMTKAMAESIAEELRDVQEKLAVAEGKAIRLADRSTIADGLAGHPKRFNHSR